MLVDEGTWLARAPCPNQAASPSRQPRRNTTPRTDAGDDRTRARDDADRIPTWWHVLAHVNLRSLCVRSRGGR